MPTPSKRAPVFDGGEGPRQSTTTTVTGCWCFAVFNHQKQLEQNTHRSRHTTTTSSSPTHIKPTFTFFGALHHHGDPWRSC